MEPEIMAPAGSFESLRAAIQAGADSVYFGVGKLNMRAHCAKKFTTDNLKEIVSICNKSNVKTYLTLNSVMYDEDIQELEETCKKAKDSKVTAIIASDLAAIKTAKKFGLRVHASTQLNISNTQAVKFFSQYTDAIVLARELKIEQIKQICENIKKENITGPSGELIKIEVFIHGALCIAISGKCYMSLAQYGRSANRGECLHACRRAYKVTDEETGHELTIDNKYVMSPRDLCTIGIIDKLIEAGVSIFKIEGRGRPPEYVNTTVKCYKEAIELINKKEYTEENIEKLRTKLKTVFNRGFWENGYYLGTKINEWANSYGSQSTEEKIFIGKIENYFAQPKIAEINIQANSLDKKDRVLIIGPTTGLIEIKNTDPQWNETSLDNVKKGQHCTLKVPSKVRKNDQVYIIRKRN